MDVICERCSKKVHDTLGNLLVEGWAQKNPEMTPTRRGWICPECAPLKGKDERGGDGGGSS
jgi:hypothetical protein